MANLIEAIQSQCNRVRQEVLPEYQKHSGNPLVAALASDMRDHIKEAEKAIADGCLMSQVFWLEKLRGWSIQFPSR